MISRAVLDRTAQFRAGFLAAQPFRHICIDDFLEPAAAAQALKDFPSFSAAKALNENGKLGLKAVNSDIAAISPFYAALGDYLGSPAFLGAMAEIIGIPDLIHDPEMFGGGTHENLHGATLDPHVDFNFDERRGYHRRANLLVYLNEEWDEAWGGAIELHSNPRRPETNTVKSFNALFNRAVVFETNEHSWHGFHRIALPPEKRHLSRKCLSVYLYTRDRPSAEIAPAHTTFYVPHALPKVLSPGTILSPENVEEIDRAIRTRNGLIEMYQTHSLQQSAMLQNARHAAAEWKRSFRPPVTGYVRSVSAVAGFETGGWIGQDATVTLDPESPVEALRICGTTPDFLPQGQEVTVAINGAEIARRIVGPGEWEIETRLSPSLDRSFVLTLHSSRIHNHKAAGTGEDERDLALMLREIRLIHESSDRPLARHSRLGRAG